MTRNRQGERGRTGDHGQHGDTGDTGATGKSGKDSPWTNARLLAIFLIVVVAFALVLLTYARQQHVLSKTIDRVNHNTVLIANQRYESCLAGVQIIKKYNANQDALKKLFLARTDVTDKVKNSYAKTYEESKILPVPSCKRLLEQQNPKPSPLKK